MSRTLRDLWRRLIVAVAPALLSGALRVLSWTVRIRFVHGEELFSRWARNERIILAFWHNRVLMMPIQSRGQPICIMNSQHRDGEIASRALQRWGIRSVRGSATRGGVAGFLRLIDAFRDGWNLAVVPDGPRGPRYAAKPGVVYLAKATGAPIFPISYAARWKLELNSWDRLVIPLPFSRVIYVAGDPLTVPRDADDGQIERLRVELEERLDQAAADAETILSGAEIDRPVVPEPQKRAR